jgi:hypothetical protein
MLIDCDSCVMRDIACADCVVTMLIGPSPENFEVHQKALNVLADAGLVAPLRLIKGDGQADQPATACQ